MPKKQVEFVWDLEDEDYMSLTMLAKKLALHLREKTGARYVGEAVIGTDVPHAHIHLIPFDETAQFYNQDRTNHQADDEVLAAVAKKLRLS